MAANVGSSSEDGDSKKPPGLGDLVSRVLGQLSVSAWLPAAMLIGVGALLVQLRIDRNPSIATAVSRLAHPKSWGILIILLFGLILTTMVTQAFSFGIIRLLEGYWGSRGPAGYLAKARVRRHVKRAEQVRERTASLERALFESAIGKLAREDPRYVQVWNEQLNVPRRERKQTDKTVIRAANAIEWRTKGDPGVAALFYRAHDRQSDYPQEPTRVLPTRLGNVLRASEEQLRLKGHALERFIMENYEKIPERLMTQHDQFRDRLDMYALLVLVFAILALGSVPLLWSVPWPNRWIPSPSASLLIFGVLSWMSYEASITSARGYGATILAIKRTIDESDRKTHSVTPPNGLPTVASEAGPGAEVTSPKAES